MREATTASGAGRLDDRFSPNAQRPKMRLPADARPVMVWAAVACVRLVVELATAFRKSTSSGLARGLLGGTGLLDPLHRLSGGERP